MSKIQFPLWKIEQLRDAVQKLEGEMNIRIFTMNGQVFRIWYNPTDRVALFGRVVWNEDEDRERVEKAYLRQIQDALDQAGVKIRIEYRDGERLLEWFDSDVDKDTIEKAYRYAMDLLKKGVEKLAAATKNAAEDPD
jgi:hypothetical protein